jgi:uncharacterized protein
MSLERFGKGPFPAVLVIAGSNGQPRSGFYAENDFIADQFVRLGLAVLTFDKRGVGASGGPIGPAEDARSSSMG